MPPFSLKKYYLLTIYLIGQERNASVPGDKTGTIYRVEYLR
jgi:hypothetical protein